MVVDWAVWQWILRKRYAGWHIAPAFHLLLQFSYNNFITAYYHCQSILSYKQSEFGPLVLEVKGGVLHNEVNDSPGGDGVSGVVDSIVLHPIPEEHYFWSGFYHEAQLLLHLVQSHVAA